MTNVVHKDRPHDVYIGRPSKWGNPFPLEHESQRAYVILKYELWLSTQPDLLRALPELKDKTLGCFCSPLACHGDVLVRFANDKYIPHWFSNMIPMGEPYMYQGVAYSRIAYYANEMVRRGYFICNATKELEGISLPDYHAATDNEIKSIAMFLLKNPNTERPMGFLILFSYDKTVNFLEHKDYIELSADLISQEVILKYHED